MGATLREWSKYSLKIRGLTLRHIRALGTPCSVLNQHWNAQVGRMDGCVSDAISQNEAAACENVTGDGDGRDTERVVQVFSQN